jgi:uncharacterized protein
VIIGPNTSPLLILGRIDRLDLLGDPERIVITKAVLTEICEKMDDAANRIAALAGLAEVNDGTSVPESVDPLNSLGSGERSVLAWALRAGPRAICILDDAAARGEARRLRLQHTGTLGLLLRAKLEGQIPEVAPLLRQAVRAGLYADDELLTTALVRVGETWKM